MPTTILSYPDFTYDTNLIQAIGSTLKLKYIQDVGLSDKTSNFATSGDFTYDSAKINLSSGDLRLKILSPTGAAFFAVLNSTINGDTGGGTLTGTAIGGAAISGGYLDLSYNDIRYV